MSGYGYPQNNPPGYAYGSSSQPGPPNNPSPYGQPPSSSLPYGAPPPPNPPYSSQPPTAQPYGAPSAPPYGKPDTNKPHKDDHKPYGGSHGSSSYPSAPPSGSSYPSSGSGYPSAPPGSGYGSGYGGSAGYGSQPGYGQTGGGGGGSLFSALLPSTFPPGTDPNVIACFQVADQDGSGLIEDKELQRALSSYNQSFSLRTVHLLMFTFTNSTSRRIGPKEFTSLFYSLQSWREIFERFDRDRSGKIDASELRDALLSLGFAVSPAVLEQLVSKFDKTGGKSRAVEYDNFIECCLTVKGLTEKFKEKDRNYSGSATFSYEDFMLTVLPFLFA